MPAQWLWWWKECSSARKHLRKRQGRRSPGERVRKRTAIGEKKQHKPERGAEADRGRCLRGMVFFQESLGGSYLILGADFLDCDSKGSGAHNECGFSQSRFMEWQCTPTRIKKSRPGKEERPPTLCRNLWSTMSTQSFSSLANLSRVGLWPRGRLMLRGGDRSSRGELRSGNSNREGDPRPMRSKAWGRISCHAGDGHTKSTLGIRLALRGGMRERK